jgi:hypothetical protein
MNEELIKKLDPIIEILSCCFDGIDRALEAFVKIAETLEKEDQESVKRAIKLLIDHMKSSLQDAEF